MFFTELKLYRKIKEQESEQWKEETKAKILRRHQLLEVHRTNSQNVFVSTENYVVQKPEKKRTKSEKSQRKCLEVIIDKTANKQNVVKNKENNREDTISTLVVSFEKCKTRAPIKKSDTCAKQLEKIENKRPVVNKTQNEIKTVNRPSRKRTKSPLSTGTRSNSVQPRSRSKSCE